MEISKEEFLKACNNKIQNEKAERERLAREKAEREKLAREKAERERLAREKAERERLAKTWQNTLKNLPQDCKRGFNLNGYTYSIDYDNKGFSKRKNSAYGRASGNDESLNEELGIYSNAVGTMQVDVLNEELGLYNNDIERDEDAKIDGLDLSKKIKISSYSFIRACTQFRELFNNDLRDDLRDDIGLLDVKDDRDDRDDRRDDRDDRRDDLLDFKDNRRRDGMIRGDDRKDDMREDTRDDMGGNRRGYEFRDYFKDI